MVLGWREATGGSTDYMLCSESLALKKLDFHHFRDVKPGKDVL